MEQDSQENSAGTESRRPLKTRGWQLFQSIAAWLSRTPVTPNMISVSSIVFACLAGCMLAATALTESPAAQAGLYLTAAACIQLRLIANMLDGMVAVEGGKGSRLGMLYNEVPDRISDVAILVGAGYSLGSRPELGLWAAIVAEFVAYVRAIGASAGAGEAFAGPMAKPHRMALLTAGCVICSVASLLGLGSDGRWQSLVIGTVLGVIIVGGMITSWRRLRIVASRLQQDTPQENASTAPSSDQA